QRRANAADPGATPLRKTSSPRRLRSRARPVGASSTSRGLFGTRDLIELCRLLHGTVARQMDATIFFLGLFDAASQTVEVVWQVENGKELSGGSFPLGKGITTQVVLSGEPRLIRRWSSEGPRVQVQYATGTPG